MVETILELLTAGSTYDELLEDYPGLEPDDIKACLAFATEITKTRSYKIIA